MGFLSSDFHPHQFGYFLAQVENRCHEEVIGRLLLL